MKFRIPPFPLLFAVVSLVISVSAASAKQISQAKELKKLSLEQLLEIRVTTASRKPELRTTVASALDVLTNERIRRSGATTYGEALRLAAGVHVIRSESYGWGISTRGMNLNTANKLQVIQDGRILYTPLFSGVFWNVHDYPFTDIDRIEVIRGPGATLWGGNAVNGVINIITLPAQETQGTMIEAGAGDEEQGFLTARYGSKIGDSVFYRGYFKYFNRDGLILANGQDAGDEWDMGRGGFRMDSKRSDSDNFTLQGDVYRGSLGFPDRDDGTVSGGNLLARWIRRFDESSELQIQAYYDRTDRKIPLQFQEKRNTYDIDMQHRFHPGRSNDFVWGFNYRASADQTENIGTVQFVPNDRTIHHFSGFAQDEISIIPEKVTIIAGTKLENNTFSGLELEPNLRFSWLPNKKQTVWGAVSRAVRVPSRLDTDLRFFPVPGLLAIKGNPHFKPEEVIAYEAGYRLYPRPKVFFDITGFYHSYDSLITLEPGAPGDPPTIGNGMNATTSGVTFSVDAEPERYIRFLGGLSLLHKKLKLDADSHDLSDAAGEGNDPDYYWVLHTMIDPRKDLQLDAILGSSGELPSPLVPAYVTMDFRIAWLATDRLELAFVGQNLFQDSHPEFGMPLPTRREIERSFYGKVTWFF